MLFLQAAAVLLMRLRACVVVAIQCDGATGLAKLDKRRQVGQRRR
jgi:hypothetical protein